MVRLFLVGWEFVVRTNNTLLWIKNTVDCLFWVYTVCADGQENLTGSF